MVLAALLGIAVQARSVLADIDLAVKLWREFDMPIPPKDADLIISQWPRTKDTKSTTLFYGYLEKGTRGTAALYSGGYRSPGGMDGYDTITWDLSKPLPISEAMMSTGQGSAKGPFHESAITSVAVQSAVLGHRQVAESIVVLEKATRQKHYYGGSFDSNPEPWLGATIDDSLASNTAFLISVHLLNEALNQKIDRREILRKMIALEKYHLLTNGPKHHLGGMSWGIKDHIKELSDTVNLPNAAGDEIQKTINSLVDLNISTSPYFEFKKTPIGQKILKFGQKAVPHLARELDKHRLTRSHVISTGNDLTGIIPVSSIAIDLLRELLKDEMSSRAVESKDAVLVWCQAKKSGKWDNFLLSTLIEPIYQANDVSYDSFKKIIMEHPYLLKRAIEKMNKAKVEAEWEYDLLADSKLSKKTKLELFRLAAEGDTILGLKGTSRPLRRVDPNAADELLLRVAKKIPAAFDLNHVTATAYFWETENPHVWDALHKSIEGSEIEMKLMLLDEVRTSPYREIPQKANWQAVHLLTRFFSDETHASAAFYKKHMPWMTGLPSVGRIALRSAAIDTKMISAREKNISEETWQKVRKELETKYGSAPQ